MTNHHFWIAQEKGYFYPCHQTKPTGDWPLIQGQLEILASEGKVEEEPEGFLLPHVQAVDLDPEISEILELPDYFPYTITLRSHGSLGSPSFRYEVEYLRPDGTPFYGLVVRGSYVELSRETCYRFNRDQYDLLSLVEESNRESQKIQDRGKVSQYNTLQLARIKERAEKSMPPWTVSWNGRKLLRLTSFPCGWKRIQTVLFPYCRSSCGGMGIPIPGSKQIRWTRGFGAIPTTHGKSMGRTRPSMFSLQNRRKASVKCASASGFLQRRPDRWQNIPGRFSVLKPLILIWVCTGTGWFPLGNSWLRICLFSQLRTEMAASGRNR